MAQTNCYALRRAPGAEEFRRAWDAALDFGLQRLKDVAFERAIEGQLVPVFVAGKLMGFRRKRNDALLMFCPRHYGQDENGKRTTINYFSTCASAGADGASGQAGASAQTTSVVVSGRSSGDGATTTDAQAALIDGFSGVRLDPEAQAAIAQALADCAARRQEADAAMDEGGDAADDATADDPDEPFLRLRDGGDRYRGELEPGFTFSEFEPFVPDEPLWSSITEPPAPLGPPEPAAAIADVKQRPSRRKA